MRCILFEVRLEAEENFFIIETDFVLCEVEETVEHEASDRRHFKSRWLRCIDDDRL
jgi:hypothetical protein